MHLKYHAYRPARISAYGRSLQSSDGVITSLVSKAVAASLSTLAILLAMLLSVSAVIVMGAYFLVSDAVRSTVKWLAWCLRVLFLE